MNAWEWAGLVCANVALWLCIACPLGAWIGKRLKERREFDGDLEAVAQAVGVLPGPEVELDPAYRSPAYDEPRRFGSGIA